MDQFLARPLSLSPLPRARKPGKPPPVRGRGSALFSSSGRGRRPGPAQSTGLRSWRGNPSWVRAAPTRMPERLGCNEPGLGCRRAGRGSPQCQGERDARGPGTGRQDRSETLRRRAHRFGARRALVPPRGVPWSLQPCSALRTPARPPGVARCQLLVKAAYWAISRWPAKPAKA